ncbi:guanylate kinase [bacterium]|nr:guanylate kinase [bacterium]
MVNKLTGKLFLIVGPSGVGKGTVIFHLKKLHPEFDYPISVTTRKPRPKEKDGVVYHFATHKEFKRMIKEGDLLEYAVVHNKEYYGTLKKTILDALKKGHTVIREVDMQGCESIQKALPHKNIVSIFLTVPNKQDLIDRILKRGKLPEEEIKRRMQSAKREFAKGGKVCTYQVPSLNGKIKKCVSDVEALILSEISN